MTTTRYHHGNLRQALVEAGVEAVREGGSDKVALRDLARRVGVSHNAAYRHFADRDELMGEIAGAGMAALGAAGAERLAAVTETDPVRRSRLRLRALGRGYVAFARAEPGLFRVAFADYPSLEGAPLMDIAAESVTAPPSGSEPGSEPGAEPAEGPFAQLVACLDDMEAVGYLAPEARPGAELTCWAAVHGLAMLLIEGPLQKLPDEAAHPIVEDVLAALDRGLGVRTGEHPPLA